MTIRRPAIPMSKSGGPVRLGAGGTHLRKLMMFNRVSLDGLFTDGAGDMSWAHSQDPEWQEFTQGNAGGEVEFLFGRKTWQMMASFWPTARALQTMPVVAQAMNGAHKTVFSTTLESAD